MRIFITNDDGIVSPGLHALRERLGPRHELFVVAPDRDRSGASQSIVVGSPFTAIELEAGVWSLSGTPADCVRVGLPALCGADWPDMVVSGINLGANLGADILLSGTVGAARQAALAGIPSVAISAVSYREPEDLAPAARFLEEHIESIAAALPAGKFLNINAPSRGGSKLVLARPGAMPYELRFEVVEGEEPRARRISLRASAVEGECGGDCLASRRGSTVLSAFGPWGPDEELESAISALLPGLAREPAELLR